MTGRGAWPNSGNGGTLNDDGNAPGPYYVLADETNFTNLVGSWGLGDRDVNRRAVTYAVTAIQRRLRVLLAADDDIHVRVDGVFGPRTRKAVLRFQQHRADQGDDITPWGGVGPDTAKLLFEGKLRRITGPHHFIVCGFVQNESAWDPGAVGYVDDDDLGFAQINGPAHPDYTEAERFNPTVAFDFVEDYLERALRTLDGDMRDAIVSYNLGIGGYSSTYDRLVGCRGWIADGRPDVWTPPGQTTPRDIRGYYTRIRTACDSTAESARAAASANTSPAPVRVGADEA